MIRERHIYRQLDTRYVTIKEVNPSTRSIEVEDELGTQFRMSLTDIPTVLAMPDVGEVWSATRRGVDWILDKRIENPGMAKPLESLSPGDRRIEASNDLHLHGKSVNISSSDGTTAITSASTTISGGADIAGPLSLQTDQSIGGDLVISGDLTVVGNIIGLPVIDLSAPRIFSFFIR